MADDAGTGPPDELVRSLVDGPSVITGVEWHPELGSTNERARELAAGGAAQVHAVLADVQTAGRGRHGRTWVAPAGSSLLLSLLLRPPVPADTRPLLTLLTGLALAEAVGPFVGPTDVSVKWPNDLLIGGRKAAGVLLETAGDAVVVGVGINVDWRGLDRPAELGTAVSLAEVAEGPVDRWRVFAALAGVFGNRYTAWLGSPHAFLADYRRRCSTLGHPVRVTQLAGAALEGTATDVADDGRLLLRDAGGMVHRVQAGDVEHVRPAALG